MISSDFISLRDHILDKNLFFHQGFANVYLDELSGLIYNMDSGDRFAIGIDDRFGNYFYLRTDADIRYTLSRPQLSDSKTTIDEVIKCYLVAVVDDADPKRLVQCLLNTLLLYGRDGIRPTRAIYIREVAVSKELSRIAKDDLLAILKDLDKLEVVIIEFDFMTNFSPSECICNPCKK